MLLRCHSIFKVRLIHIPTKLQRVSFDYTGNTRALNELGVLEIA